MFAAPLNAHTNALLHKQQLAQSTASGTEFAKTKKAEFQGTAAATRIKQQQEVNRQAGLRDRQLRRQQQQQIADSPTAKLRKMLAAISQGATQMHLPSVHMPQLHMPEMPQLHLPAAAKNLHLPAVHIPQIRLPNTAALKQTITHPQRLLPSAVGMRASLRRFGSTLRAANFQAMRSSIVPAAILAYALVALASFIGIITSNLNYSKGLDAVGLGQLIGLGNRHPTIDRYAFNFFHTILRGGAGGGNWAWSRLLSKPPVVHENGTLGGAFFAYGWYAADFALATAFFAILTQRGLRMRNAAVAAFLGQLALKSLWGVFRLGMRSTAISFGYTVAYLLAVIGATAAAGISGSRIAGGLMALVTIWAAANVADAAAIWKLNH